jgi:hypothetical protein
VGIRLLLRQPCEGGQRPFGARLDERGVADERDTFEASRSVAAGVECAAIERTLQAVVAHQAGHDDRPDGTLGEKVEYFRLAVRFSQGVNQNGRLGVRRSRRGHLPRISELGHRPHSLVGSV